jgi:hypothetical protein
MLLGREALQEYPMASLLRLELAAALYQVTARDE